jgi:fatty-acyl-CoA synthase
MAGYYSMPEKTAEAIDKDGWLHTGDLATMNARGYINIVGRQKDMVIRGGENIFPREIEEFLMRHPKVADVAVLCVPDQFFGEELLAVVIPNQGAQLTEQEIREYCQGQISHQKIPRYVRFVDAYPLTETPGNECEYNHEHCNEAARFSPCKVPHPRSPAKSAQTK